MHALVTGITGFAGRALAARLAELNWSVVGSHGGRHPIPPALRRAGIRLVTHDLADPAQLRALLESIRPPFIFHLAGQTGIAFEAALRSHVAGTANLLEAARLTCRDAVIVVPGSSAQFGDVAEDRQPIREEMEYRPRTLYGIAKAAEAWTAGYFCREHGMKIVRTNTFNCIGPGQRPEFVPATFARQIARMERGCAEPVLHVGNLATRRDMTDIRDVADAYVHAATAGHPGAVYNVCSGQAPTIGAVVARLRELSRVDFDIRQDPDRRQAADVVAQCGDASRLQRDTGWKPAIALHQSLADVLEEWRANA